MHAHHFLRRTHALEALLCGFQIPLLSASPCFSCGKALPDFLGTNIAFITVGGNPVGKKTGYPSQLDRAFWRKFSEWTTAMQVFNANMGTSQNQSNSAGAGNTGMRAAMVDNLKNQAGHLDQAVQSLSVLIRQHCQSVPTLG